MAKCLVLGADGFIGSFLSEALVKAGHSVRAFDHFRTGQPRNLKPTSKLEIYPGDFLDRDQIEAAVRDMEYVFHFISVTNPATSTTNPLVDVEANVKMSVELFYLCSKAGVERLIFPSTGGAVYGSDQARPFKETDLPEPISPYAIGKLAIEHYLRFFNRTRGLDYLIYRVSNPYGARQNTRGAQGVIPIFLNYIQEGKPLTVFGDGSMVRDYIYIDDLIAAIVGSFDQDCRHHLYNLGSGEGTSLNDLIKILFEVTGKNVPVNYSTARPSDVHRVELDMSRFEDEFHIKAQVPLPKGIELTWKHVLNESRHEVPLR